jgi:cyclopropane-fatty-acyl-phospholipid synthase
MAQVGTANSISYPSLPAGIKTFLDRTLANIPLTLHVNCWNRDYIHVENRQNQLARLTLTINHPGVVRALLLTQDLMVLPEAYLQGLIEVDGSLDALLPLIQTNPHGSIQRKQFLRAWLEAWMLPRLPGLRSSGSFWTAWRRHTRDRDRQAIQSHYDLGNSFYRLWLDPHLVYSCAYFAQPQTSLQDAQEAKLDLICRKLQLSPGESMLDVGCGWGALLRWAVTRYGVTGYGITLSQEQFDYNQQQIAAAGLRDRLKVELLDYRDLPKTPTFDKIVSVGMIEHVGIRNYPVYFQALHAALKPGGLLLNHAINSAVIYNGSSWGERFIARYIFPDGELATLSQTLVAAEDNGWEIVDVDAWRPHYAETLRRWARNIDAASDQVIACIGKPRFNIWRLYLLGCAFAFQNNAQGIYQTLLRRKADADWNLPMTRQHWCYDGAVLHTHHSEIDERQPTSVR